jgi:DNA-directed RNA polymerase subunit RPC12/RpoP
VTRLICPACTAPSLTFDKQGILECPYCGTRIVGEAQVCSACGHVNPVEAEQCLSCGEPLTLTARVVLRQRSASGEPLFLRRARGQAAGLKSQGERASVQRMDHFREMDRQRQARDADELARTRARDRQLLVVSAGALALLVIAILIGFLAVVLR